MPTIKNTLVIVLKNEAKKINKIKLQEKSHKLWNKTEHLLYLAVKQCNMYTSVHVGVGVGVCERVNICECMQVIFVVVVLVVVVLKAQAHAFKFKLTNQELENVKALRVQLF